ncbi:MULTISPECIES: gamma-glutamyl-gamma-aminobutyrate hydrolase family protein [Sporosarcina]|nr:MULTISPECIES: gamma-glutamyl-gamma-aminobutyrate hydrolase family protein [Sporosarcina]
MAKDGVIEAFESTEHTFLVGVQWHPEALVKRDDATSLRLFERFVEAAT